MVILFLVWIYIYLDKNHNWQNLKAEHISWNMYRLSNYSGIKGPNMTI